MAMTWLSHLPKGDDGIERLLAAMQMQRRGTMTRFILQHNDKNAGTSISVIDMPAPAPTSMPHVY